MMDERTEIDEHRKDLLNLFQTLCSCPQNINDQLREMTKRFAHTFFYPNHYAKDFCCKHCLETSTGGCCVD
jgi:hypothetical protein